MPEGHKTHFLAARHTELLAGQKVSVSSPQGRFSSDAATIDGKKLQSACALGKQMFYRFGKDSILQIHLGRYGSFRQHDNPPPAPVGAVRMRMVGRESTIDLNGPTVCRVIDEKLQRAICEKLGPDPLAGGKPGPVWESISTSAKPIGALLLDQSIVAGVGNIFRAELLFELELDPLLPGSELSKTDFDRIWKALGKMMRTGLKYGKIITVSSKEAGKPLAKLDNKERLRIYGKADCPRCGAKIEKINVGSRDLYVCKNCQAPFPKPISRV
jgi:endonuclease-8